MRISDWSSDVCSSDLEGVWPSSDSSGARDDGKHGMMFLIPNPGPTAMRQPIHTDKAPAAIGPYSQAVRCGDTVYMSGQIPIDPATGALVARAIAAQARRAFGNLGAVCEAPGGSLDDGNIGIANSE